jgi:hypothetical protein
MCFYYSFFILSYGVCRCCSYMLLQTKMLFISNFFGNILVLWECGPGWRSWYSDLPWAGRSSGIESRWEARFSAPIQTHPGVHPASYTVGTGSLSQGLSSQGVTLTTHPHLMPRLKKEYSCTSTPPLGLHGLF